MLVCSAGLVAGQGREPVWLKVEAENFTVLSALNEKATAAWAGEFSLFLGTLKRFITFDSRRLPPITIVLFARDRDFAPYRVVGANGKPLTEIAGFFSRRETWAVAGLAGTSSQDVRRIIFHEGVHWLFSAYQRPNPVWVEEGVAEVFSTFAFARKKMSWGSGIEEHAFALQMGPFIPLERLMYLDKATMFHGGGHPVGMLYAQSWAFAHYLLFGQHSLPKDALDTYLKLYHSAIHPDEAFKRAFGTTYAEMQKRLEAYVHGGKYLIFEAPLPDSAPFPVSRAEPVEVQIGLARLAVASQRLALAREHAEAAVAVLPEDPRGYEMLGIVHDEAGDPAASELAYRAALDRGSKDFRSTFRLGLALQLGAAGKLTAEDARAASRYYQLSINLHPYQPDAYRNLAGLAPLLAAPTPEDKRFLDLGLRLFPDDGMITLGLAVLARKTGQFDEAMALVAQVIEQENRHDRATREFANALDREWSYQHVIERMQRAAQEKRYADAVRYADEAMAMTFAGSYRSQLMRQRRDFQALEHFEAARRALESADHADARRLADAIIASEASNSIKASARQILEHLNRSGRNVRPPPNP